MKICYFTFDSIGSVFTPLLLDDALINAKENNHEVDFVYCDAALPSCGINYFKSNSICTECGVNRQLLLGKYKNVKNLNFIPLSSIKTPEQTFPDQFFDFENLDQLKAKEYKGINVGIGAVSSFVTKTRNMSPEFNESTKEVFKNFLTTASKVSDSVVELDKKNNYDEIRLCNGRLITERAVFETAKFLKKNISVLELSNSDESGKFKKVNYGPFLPHDIENGTKLVEDYWNKSESNIALAEQFFENRRNGKHAGDKVYTGAQQAGSLPKNWDTNKRNFTIFNSSEDEFFSIGGFWEDGKVFPSHAEAIHYLLSYSEKYENIHFYLRIHPNLKDVKFKYVTELFSLERKFKNITVIPGDSEISTYTLIDQSEKFFVFGGSVGVEANYCSKPVISLAPSMYHYLNIAYFPTSIEHLNSLILDTLEVKPKMGSLKYGHYVFGKRGSDFKYINFDYDTYYILNKKIVINSYLTIKMLLVKAFYRALRLFSTLKYAKKTKDLFKEI